MEDVKILVFQGLPRESKTYEALSQLENVTTGIYLSAKHEIVDQSFNRFLCPVGKTAVKMEGKSRLCKTRTFNCSTCPMKPDETDSNHIGFFDLKLIAENLLEKHRKVSRDEIKSAETDEIKKKYGGLCPYYTLKMAMERCNYIFTVPQIRVPKEIVDLLVIDEDPTLSYYFPQSVKICSFTHLPYNSSVQVDIPDFQFIVDEIDQKAKKRALDRDILKAINTLDAWRKILVSFKDNEIKRDKIIDILDKTPVPVFEDRDAAYSALSRRLIGDERSGVFDAVFYPAPIRFYLEKGKHTNTIFSIADSDHQVREFPPSERTLLIGATMAEKIASASAPGACSVREFKSFWYANNFAIIPVKDVTKISIKDTEYERVSREKTQKFLLTIAETLTRNNIPCIIVTGSKQVQRKVESDLRDMRVSMLVCQQETRDELDDNALHGVPTIIYANGSTSRGIDLDNFDVTLFYHAEYSTPYWSAMEAYWKGKDDEKSREYGDIREQIHIDETVNLAFRTAPVKGVWEGYPKILFIPEYYLERIRTRCEELHATEKLESAISEHTISPQNVDVGLLGAEIGAQIRSVTKIREKGKRLPESDSDGFDGYELSLICNQYPDLPHNAPILGAVREGRLVEFLVGLVLKDTERSVRPGDIPAYLEQLIRSLVTECIRTHSPADKNGVFMVSTMDLIAFVQFPSKEWITNNPDVVMPDSRNERSRPQKYLATRDQVRKVLKRMKSDGLIKQTRKGGKDMWSLPPRVSTHTGTVTHTNQPSETTCDIVLRSVEPYPIRGVVVCPAFENLENIDPSIDKSASKPEEAIFE